MAGARLGVASRAHAPVEEVSMSIVIVGAGLAGGTAATELREQGHTGPVVLVGAEQHAPYERPPLSKGYLLGNDPIDDAFVHPLEWYAEHDVDLRLGVEATALDTDAKVVHTSAGDLALRAAAAGHRGRAATPGPRRGERRAHGLPAHHRGQRPAQGGLREGRPDRGRRRRLDRAGGRRGRTGGRLRGDRLRDGRPAAAAGARADGGAGLRRPAPQPRRRPAPGHRR